MPEAGRADVGPAVLLRLLAPLASENLRIENRKMH